MQILSESSIDRNLLAILRCPASGKKLEIDGEGLTTIDGSHRYPVVSGIPCLIPMSAKPMHAGYVDVLEDNYRLWSEAFDASDHAIKSFVDSMIVATSGNLFRGAYVDAAYPIAEFPGGFLGDPILDIGCNWGRWTIAGGKAGHWMVGVDTHLRALLCAQALSRKFVSGQIPSFVLADARMLPFASESVAAVFSYSVLQHFSEENVTLALAEIQRVLRHGGKSVIQMPNRRALRSLWVLAHRKFSKGSEFDVRYYTIGELLQLFSRHIGRSDWRVDCFLGLNVHGFDRKFVRPSRRWVIDIAEALRRASESFPLLRRYADSVLVRSFKA
jgi:SAM-dependent methyltransferase